MRRRPQHWVAVSFGSAVLLASAALGVGARDARPAGAASSRAVVNIGGANQVISFGSSVTGLQALRMVASVTTTSFGGNGEAVCSINGKGNAVDECLVGPNGEYWSYWRAPPGAGGWQYSSQGAGGTVVTDGWVEGWRYGTGGPPPFTSFCAVAGCAPPPTAAPPTTVAAPSVAGSSATAPGPAPGSDGSTPTTRAKDSGAPAAADDGDDQASTRDREDGSRNDDREQAAGTTGAGDDGGGGSPAGIAAVGGIVAALGVGGVALRRRRSAPVPPA